MIAPTATTLAPTAYSAIHIILPPQELETDSTKIVPIFPQLLNALAHHGTLHAPSSPALRGELVLAGFVILTERDSEGILIAQRPALASTSAALPLRRLKGASSAANGQKKAAKAALWALAAAPSPGVGTVDAEALLTAEDRARPAACEPGATVRGAGPRRRRACKGCTCGLAEELAAEAAAAPVVLVDGMEGGAGARVVDQAERTRLLAAAAAAPKATSSCGNCHLGDAFRCDGCPYLGTLFFGSLFSFFFSPSFPADVVMCDHSRSSGFQAGRESRDRFWHG